MTDTADNRDNVTPPSDLRSHEVTRGRSYPEGVANRCGTCKWFTPPAKTYDLGYGRCGLAEGGGEPMVVIDEDRYDRDEVRRCKNTGETPAGWPPMWASDCSSYSAGLNVLPTFGCVAWVPIPS